MNKLLSAMALVSTCCFILKIFKIFKIYKIYGKVMNMHYKQIIHKQCPESKIVGKQCHKNKITIYVLKLEHNKFYIGKTSRTANERIQEHFDNNGSEWTKLYKPLDTIEIISDANEYDEDNYTKKYMNIYGIKNVRGGSYISTKLPLYQILSLEKEFRTANNKCFKCNKNGHIAKNCKSILK